MRISDPSQLDRGAKTYGASARRFLVAILLVTLLERPREVWTSTLIRALAACGIQDRNARQTINRIADTGMIRAEKVGARARWRLTEDGRRRLDRGRKRAAAFNGVQRDWDGQWLVVICSVPESERDKRRRFRSQLEFAGFGFVQPGIAVSTHLEKEAMIDEVLKDFGLVEGSLVLKARPGNILKDERLLERAWDIEALSKHYTRFISIIKSMKPQTDEQKFAAFVELERAWLYAVLSDPELPQNLLPAAWPGIDAKKIYEAAHAEWCDAAIAWFDRIDASLD